MPKSLPSGKYPLGENFFLLKWVYRFVDLTKNEVMRKYIDYF